MKQIQVKLIPRIFQLDLEVQTLERNIQEEAILKLHRNSRKPNRANHGARPCSSYMRRLKHKDYHKKITENKSDVIEPELIKLSTNPDLSSMIRKEDLEEEQT